MAETISLSPTAATPTLAVASLPLGRPPGFAVPRAVVPRSVPPGAGLKDPALYFNQELSWIDFNWRVLHLALDDRTPLLERVRFVAITASNLDEFVQKRVGGLKRQDKGEGAVRATAHGHGQGFVFSC